MYTKTAAFFILMILFSGCFSHSALMTRDTFDDIALGTPVAEVRTLVGNPYAVHSKGGSSQEYEYIERIDMGTETIAENHYFLIISDGHVIGKRVTRQRPPAFDMIYSDDPNYVY